MKKEAVVLALLKIVTQQGLRDAKAKQYLIDKGFISVLGNTTPKGRLAVYEYYSGDYTKTERRTEKFREVLNVRFSL